MNLTKRFDDVTAVDGISLDVAEGEFVTLLGPSGCGKTTTLRAVAGFHQPDQGEIWFGDRLMNNVPPNKRSTAMCFQSYALFPHMMLKNSSHQAAALLWISFITSKEPQLKKFTMLNAYPARTDVTIESTMLTEADRQNALAWFPAAYKAYMISEFTKNVLMK